MREKNGPLSRLSRNLMSAKHKRMKSEKKKKSELKEREIVWEKYTLIV